MNCTCNHVEIPVRPEITWDWNCDALVTEDDIQGISDDEGEKGIQGKTKNAPVKPSQKEVEEHEKTHIPFRAWCEHCIKGQAVSDPHKNQASEDTHRDWATISMDYMWLKTDDKGEGQGMPIIVTHDSESKGITAHVVPEKGCNEYSIRRVMQDLEMTGHVKISLKSD